METLHRLNTLVTNSFIQGWKDGVLHAFGIDLEINGELMAKVSNRLIEGAKFYREKKCTIEAFKTFLTLTKREKMKNTNEGLNRTALLEPWKTISEVIM